MEVSSVQPRGALRPVHRRRDRWIPYALTTFVIILVAAPVLFTILKSTQSSTQVLAFPPRLLPGTSLLDNYRTAWSQFGLGHLMLNSAFMAVVGTAGKILTALFGALAFVYFDFPLKSFWFFFVLLTLMLPIPVTIVPLFDLVAKLGWANTYYALTVPYMASATAMFLFRQHFMSIPGSIVDAARIDGAGPMRFLWRILVPMSKNVIGAIVVIQFIFLWNEYLWPLIIISQPSMQVVQIGMKQLIGGSAQGFTNWGMVMAGAMLALLPPLVVLIALHRQFMQGVGLVEEK